MDDSDTSVLVQGAGQRRRFDLDCRTVGRQLENRVRALVTVAARAHALKPKLRAAHGRILRAFTESTEGERKCLERGVVLKLKVDPANGRLRAERARQLQHSKRAYMGEVELLACLEPVLTRVRIDTLDNEDPDGLWYDHVRLVINVWPHMVERAAAEP